MPQRKQLKDGSTVVYARPTDPRPDAKPKRPLVGEPYPDSAAGPRPRRPSRRGARRGAPTPSGASTACWTSGWPGAAARVHGRSPRRSCTPGA
jgi:hypothetical protein